MMYEEPKTILDRLEKEAEAAAEAWWKDKIVDPGFTEQESRLYRQVFARGYLEAIKQKGLYLGNK